MNNVIKSRFSHQFPNHHQSLHELNNFYNTCVSHVHFISIYYKERRQLKTFLIQFGPTLSLTPDPPVRFVDDQKSETTIKTAIWEAFLPKKIIIFSTCARTRWAHTSLPGKNPFCAAHLPAQATAQMRRFSHSEPMAVSVLPSALLTRPQATAPGCGDLEHMAVSILLLSVSRPPPPPRRRPPPDSPPAARVAEPCIGSVLIGAGLVGA
jgi:hypothetical protein